MSEPTPHPHFDDRGTLSWLTSLAEAKVRAQAENKKIFIEFGREQCSQCRSLVETVVPRPDVGPTLQKHFIAVAADADQAEPEVLALAGKLEDAMMLPFVLFADADGKFLDGYSGVVSAPYLKKTLGELVGEPA